MSVDLNDILGIGGGLMVCTGIGLLFGYEWSLIAGGSMGLYVGVKRA